MGELLPGTLDLLILETLRRGPMHGYGIAQFIKNASDDVLRVEEGALYPALHRLEVRGWILGWGSAAEVLEPAELRTWVAQETAKAASRYR